MVQIMIAEGMLEKVEPNTLRELQAHEPAVGRRVFRPGRDYSVPYQWGTTGFMVDTAVYDGESNTLAILFDPPAPLKGKINMLKDVNDVINMGLRYLGHRACNSNRAS